MPMVLRLQPQVLKSFYDTLTPFRDTEITMTFPGSYLVSSLKERITKLESKMAVMDKSHRAMLRNARISIREQVRLNVTLEARITELQSLNEDLRQENGDLRGEWDTKSRLAEVSNAQMRQVAEQARQLEETSKDLLLEAIARRTRDDLRDLAEDMLRQARAISSER